MSDNLDKTSAKILVLGDSGVGKSSLIHLICHSAVLNSVQWTIGCSIDVKLYENNYYLEFWDIGGSRSHKIARSFLYQDYHGIMLVFDATNKKSRVNLDEWLTDALQNKNNNNNNNNNDKDLNTLLSKNHFPIITIATKKDLLPYGTVLDSSASGGSSRSSSSTGYNEEDCSVINISANEQNLGMQNYNQSAISNLSLSNNNALNRRHQSQSYSSSTTNNLSYQSSLSSATSFSASNEPLLGNEVIYVNTQDVLSFDPGSKNYQKLNNFFKHVIGRRNQKYNYY